MSEVQRLSPTLIAEYILEHTFQITIHSPAQIVINCQVTISIYEGLR
jgi:hypothetical protein